MIASAGSDYSPGFLLLSEVAEGSGCTSDFEAADGLQILAFEEDISLVLGGEVGGAL